jgi:hypothetical protein
MTIIFEFEYRTIKVDDKRFKGKEVIYNYKQINDIFAPEIVIHILVRQHLISEVDVIKFLDDIPPQISLLKYVINLCKNTNNYSLLITYCEIQIETIYKEFKQAITCDYSDRSDKLDRYLEMFVLGYPLFEISEYLKFDNDDHVIRFIFDNLEDCEIMTTICIYDLYNNLIFYNKLTILLMIRIISERFNMLRIEKFGELNRIILHRCMKKLTSLKKTRRCFNKITSIISNAHTTKYSIKKEQYKEKEWKDELIENVKMLKPEYLQYFEKKCRKKKVFDRKTNAYQLEIYRIYRMKYTKKVNHILNYLFERMEGIFV